MQAQLATQLAAIVQSLEVAKVSMCQNNDSAGALASLLQATVGIPQAESLLGEINSWIQEQAGQ
ncbi:MAG: hypothetical protein ACUVWR_04685 [Anaerolineae bacterium]